MTKAKAIKALQEIAGSVAFWTYNEDGTLRSSADLRTGDMAYDMVVEIRDILTSLGIEISDKEEEV